MTANEAYQEWMRENELRLFRDNVVGYNETPVGITIFLKNATGVTGIPYPYKYEGGDCLLAW